ncbi:GSCFA domain-containing protein [uncultured Tenacibaculum sp.]|uniref:GSCFA domain-containing protein n=1 Tax=uncultured Tenacibaculum sp. TaxID=174713 RepID=UPI00261C9646|nr:GSCFA domain-containing protein [uncultured Tenacibaculum sp.]
MILSTQIPVKKNPHNQIDYNSELILIGSCFTENIGKKLNYYKFKSNQNPLGILFHPKAIECLITNVINEKQYSESDVFLQNERWHCFDAHSSLSATNKTELLNTINNRINSTHQQLKKASHIIITLGTSWVYRHISSDKIVANCHKIPQKIFSKEILSVDEITENLSAINSLIKSVNKKISITYTVSPVRHLKDGFIENQRSKSHLISAVHQVIEPRKNIHYFPSYEIMMDELRDYRFYSEDMIHPNKTAINYIWEKFCATYISDEALKTMQEIETIQRGLNHKPFNPKSEAHLKFLNNLQQKKETLQKAFPFIKF